MCFQRQLHIESIFLRNIFVIVLLLSIVVALSEGPKFRTIPKCEYRIQQARDNKDRNTFHHIMLNLCLEKLSTMGPV